MKRFRCYGQMALIVALSTPALLLVLLGSSVAQATVYAYQSPITLSWTPSSGSVEHYNVYVATDGGPFQMLTEASTNRCTLSVQDRRTYVVQVDAEDAQGAKGPMSDPSEPVTVFLQGSGEDTDGDGMPNTWEGLHGFDPHNPADGATDADGDGLSNREEFQAGTLPRDADSDEDGVADGIETDNGQNPLSAADNVPVARAGQDQELDPTVVTLNGTGSYDPNGDPLQHAWTQTLGPSVKLSSASASSPTFIGKKAGEYRFRLVVSDGRVNSLPDEVSILIHNVRPSADAGKDRTLTAGTSVALDGSGSNDPNEDALSYSWSQVSGTTVLLQDAARQRASFVPSSSGVYKFDLVVCDTSLCSDPDRVQMTVNGINHVPSARAGADQTVRVGQTVVLDGSGSTDADGDALTYSWSQAEGPAQVVLLGSGQAEARFSASRVGVYRFELVVDDGTDQSAADSVAVTVEQGNRKPVAVAAAPAAAAVGEWIILDGTASSDPDGDDLTYTWTQIGGALVSLEDPESQALGFYAVTEGVVEFELVVEDGELPSEPDRVTIAVTDDGDGKPPVGGGYQSSDGSGGGGGGGCSVAGTGASGKEWDRTGAGHVAVLFLPALLWTLRCKRRAQARIRRRG
ncbi:MAG: PKD domain-containing protein [bacterium]